MKRAPVQNSNESPEQGYSNTITTRAGRRGASSLWFAIRTLNGAQLTTDDVRILSEALADLQAILEGAK
ncbi:hypothetical protein [Acidithiobacillus ferriphilus]|jgi:hypothetical protein|uniref:hypothetical protein n=1 Tax=Acidithiobacillus ferriphilus TaxID=1689834 RepID=UPI00242E7FE8|nr:hypothetical protein [Acidithiobacillus ferriphilus]